MVAPLLRHISEFHSQQEIVRHFPQTILTEKHELNLQNQ
jgi:hypothetical protein